MPNQLLKIVIPGIKLTVISFYHDFNIISSWSLCRESSDKIRIPYFVNSPKEGVIFGLFLSTTHCMYVCNKFSKFKSELLTYGEEWQPECWFQFEKGKKERKHS